MVLCEAYLCSIEGFSSLFPYRWCCMKLTCVVLRGSASTNYLENTNSTYPSLKGTVHRFHPGVARNRFQLRNTVYVERISFFFIPVATRVDHGVTARS